MHHCLRLISRCLVISQRRVILNYARICRPEWLLGLSSLGIGSWCDLPCREIRLGRPRDCWVWLVDSLDITFKSYWPSWCPRLTCPPQRPTSLSSRKVVPLWSRPTLSLFSCWPWWCACVVNRQEWSCLYSSECRLWSWETWWNLVVRAWKQAGNEDDF